MYYYPYPRLVPIKVKGGLKAKSRRGKIGETWWSDRWIALLESFGLGSRLARGKRYARQGQVINYKISLGLVTAKVQGSRPRPYDVTIRVKTLSKKQWAEVSKTMASKAIFAAKLLAGEMPKNIEDAFTATKLTLFPKLVNEIHTSCSCPDVANPCKHIAAVYYLLAEEFDRDPFMIFRLRGMSKQELLHMLRIHRREKKERGKKEIEKIDEINVERFWITGKELDDIKVTIRAPDISCSVLKRLGPPPFQDDEFTKFMEKCYRIVSEKAIKTAFRDKDTGVED